MWFVSWDIYLYVACQISFVLRACRSFETFTFYVSILYIKYKAHEALQSLLVTTCGWPCFGFAAWTPHDKPVQKAVSLILLSPGQIQWWHYNGALYGDITMVPCMVTLQWCPVWWHYNGAPYGDITMVPCMVTLQWCPVWWHYKWCPVWWHYNGALYGDITMVPCMVTLQWCPYGDITMVPHMVTLQWCPVWWHYNGALYGDMTMVPCMVTWQWCPVWWQIHILRVRMNCFFSQPFHWVCNLRKKAKQDNRRHLEREKLMVFQSTFLPLCQLVCSLHCMLFTSWFRVCCNVCDVPVACFQLTAGKSDDMPHNENLITQQYHSLQSITWLSHKEQWLEDQEEMSFSIFMFRDFSCWCSKAIFSFGLVGLCCCCWLLLFFWGVGGHIKYLIVLFGKLNSRYAGVMSSESVAHQLAFSCANG